MKTEWHATITRWRDVKFVLTYLVVGILEHRQSRHGHRQKNHVDLKTNLQYSSLREVFVERSLSHPTAV